MICVGIFILLFTISIEVMFYIKGDIPGDLVTGVFGACSGEGLFCMLIYIFKKPRRNNCEEEVENDE